MPISNLPEVEYKSMADAPSLSPNIDFPSYLAKGVPYHPHGHTIFMGGSSMFQLSYMILFNNRGIHNINDNNNMIFGIIIISLTSDCIKLKL
jgi:hypothetical protein